MRTRISLLPPTSILFMMLAGPALATDGVLEISQTCAKNTGCFSGDSAGFPVTISLLGSDRLTSNLDVRNEVNPQNVTAIDVNTDRVIETNTEGYVDGAVQIGTNLCGGNTTCP